MGGEDAVVVVGGEDEGGWVGGVWAGVVEGGVAEEGAELGLALGGGAVVWLPGVADGELVEAKHVKDADVGDGGGEEVGALELDGGDEEAAVRAAFDG